MNQETLFTTKTASYHHRWDYAPAAIDAICAAMHGCRDKQIADLGTGNGMLGKHFLKRGAEVYGVDPNQAMLALAQNALAAELLFHAINAPAEATTLPAQTMDALVIGRALHWFEPDAARQEMQRILKPTGLLAILSVQPADKRIRDALLSVRSAAHGWDMRYGGRRPPLPPYAFYFGHEEYQTLHFSQIVSQDWAQFWGELCSRSAAPDADAPQMAQFRQAAQHLFANLSHHGCFTLETITTVVLGQVL